MTKFLRNENIIVSLLFVSVGFNILINYLNRVFEYPIILKYIGMSFSAIFSTIMISYIVLRWRDWKNEIKRNKKF